MASLLIVTVSAALTMQWNPVESSGIQRSPNHTGRKCQAVKNYEPWSMAKRSLRTDQSLSMTWILSVLSVLSVSTAKSWYYWALLYWYREYLLFNTEVLRSLASATASIFGRFLSGDEFVQRIANQAGDAKLRDSKLSVRFQAADFSGLQWTPVASSEFHWSHDLAKLESIAHPSRLLLMVFLDLVRHLPDHLYPEPMSTELPFQVDTVHCH